MKKFQKWDAKRVFATLIAVLMVLALVISLLSSSFFYF